MLSWRRAERKHSNCLATDREDEQAHRDLLQERHKTMGPDKYRGYTPPEKFDNREMVEELVA